MKAAASMALVGSPVASTAQQVVREVAASTVAERGGVAARTVGVPGGETVSPGTQVEEGAASALGAVSLTSVLLLSTTGMVLTGKDNSRVAGRVSQASALKQHVDQSACARRRA